MIVAPQPEAADVGARILEQGGNAVDAAVACALVQGVVDPMMAGIGGFGSMQLYMPGAGVHTNVEFYARAPLSAQPGMWADRLSGRTSDGFAYLLKDRANEIGYQAICTPASLKGYATALERFGTMDWRDIVEPARRYAAEGFIVRPHVHWFWTLDQSDSNQVNISDKIAFSNSGRQMYLTPDGAPKKPGDIVINTSLATTLEKIARGGADVFYKGEVAEEICADMKRNGGLITMEDLAQLEVTFSDPLIVPYRDYRVSTLSPPSSGMTMLQILRILNHFNFSGIEHGSFEHLRLVSEATKYAVIDKDRFMGDPLYVDVPVEELLSDAYTKRLADRINNGEFARIDRAIDNSQRDTTHISVVDAQGNAVTLTHTLGSPSGVITESLGFMYNGTMSRFDPRPGRAASIAPGKRRASSAAPTIVFKDDAPYIVIGAPGGSYIAPAVAQGLMNVIDYNMPMLDAVSAPRFMAVSNKIDVSNRIRRHVTDELQANGYVVKRSATSYPFAALHGILIQDGRCSGGADPQRDGMAVSVEAGRMSESRAAQI